jgi:O-antigen ligase
MKLAKTLGIKEAKKIQTLILACGVLTTLAIWTKLEDPVNLPKMVVLVLFSSAILGISIPYLLSRENLSNRSQKIGVLLAGFFLIGLLISTLATDVKYTAVFGEYHRNNGALTLAASAIIMIASALVFANHSTSSPLRTFSYLGTFLSTYGLAQLLGQDPVGWSNKYNPIITTLGNPNFTSGLIGISGIASLYLLLNSKNHLNRAMWAFFLLFQIFIVIKSESVQGLFAFAVGAAILLLVKSRSLSKAVAISASSLILAIGISILSAIFNVGPLAARLYQGTLSNRLDYWNAAINMFQANPVFGVGIDRYGEYYREFAVQDQVVQGIFTSNAHNVYLQLLGTGGLTLFIPYISLLLFVTWVALRGVYSAKPESRILAATYFAIWISFLVLNIVTIDNIGVGTWMWIFGGIILGRSALNDQEVVSKKQNKSASQNLFVSQRLMAIFLVVAALTMCAPILAKSTRIQELKFNLNSLDESSYLSSISLEADKNRENPQNLAVLADLAFQRDYPKVALEISKKILSADARSFNGHFFQAILYETTNQRSSGIPYREKLLEIDKWNTDNMVELVKSYLEINEFNKAKNLAMKIESLYPGSENSIKAASLVNGLGK